MVTNALFVINPVAGRGAGLKTWREIEKLITRKGVVEAVIPTSKSQTRKVAAEAVKAGIERVIVVGGDGTLATVAGELAFTRTVLGVVPAGTGNDFCRNAGIPARPDLALEMALSMPPQEIDLGQAGRGEYFLNAAGIGFDAEVAAVAGRFPSGLGGTLPYLLGALTAMARYKPVHMDVTVDEQRFSGPVMLVAIANGKCYGGGMQIAPLAHPCDGKLDVCIVGRLGWTELLSLLRQVYRGAHVRHPQVQMLRGKHVRLHATKEIRTHLDGEPHPGDRLAFEVRPKALSVAMPLPHSL